MAMPWECFSFGTACGAIMFAVAIDRAISCNLGKAIRDVLTLSFLHVYWLTQQKKAFFHHCIQILTISAYQTRGASFQMLHAGLASCWNSC
jgi:hypothetical protein